MSKRLLLGTALMAGLAGVQCGDSSTGPGQGTFDITGTWTASMTQLTRSGPCPATPTTQAGSAAFSKSGGALKMVLSGGFTCSPAAACSFTGTVDGANYAFTNGGVADSEGGTYTTTIAFEATSSKSAAGNGTSIYAHPAGQCLWVFDFTLSR